MSKRFTSESDQRMLDADGPLPVDTWLVSDCGLLREEGKYTLSPVAIGLSGARISRVIAAHELRRGQERDQAERRAEVIIDVGKKPVVPAFVNGHTHLALAPLRGIASLARRTKNVVTDTFFRFEKHLTAADVRVFARLGAFESALHGVGQVWDHYYYGEEVAEALCEVGLGGVVAPTLQDVSGPGASRSAEELSATLTIHASARLREAGVTAALGPHASDTVSDELFRQVRELACREDLPVHLHLAQSCEEALAGEGRFPGGLSSVVLEQLSFAKVVLAHGLYLSEHEVERLAQSGCVLAYCPYSQLQFGFLGPLWAWHKAGGGLCLGTDCVASNDALDVQRELALVAGEAALRASFSQARKDFAATGNRGLLGEIERARISHLEASRAVGAKSIADSNGLSEPDRLLDVLFGWHLEAITGIPSGIREGGWAHLLVLDPEHPTLYPGDDLARSIAYGATSGAISFSIMAGQVRGQGEGLSRELLGGGLYRETLSEARRRRQELLDRVARTEALPSS